MSAATLYCTDERKDQIRSIEWAFEDETYSKLVDWKKGTGILGHSMGGQATRNSASNKKVVEKWNISAAVVMHGETSLFGPPIIPTFYGTGTSDHLVPAL
jgi:dienelactone hydrolase